MEQMLNKYPESEIMIFSGEGINGSFETYTGTRTQRAIKSRLTKERCNGDRWAKAYIYTYDTAEGRLFVNLDCPDDTKEIREF